MRGKPAIGHVESEGQKPALISLELGQARPAKSNDGRQR